ncbi:MAG TPA: hypothetical protein EYN67_07440 [Flavobacteriales bacterium]|nr:hypothetical protein [Flavobacteriales bacterium]
MGGEGHEFVQTICQHPAVVIRPNAVRPVEITMVPTSHRPARATNSADADSSCCSCTCTIMMVQSSCRHVVVHVDKRCGTETEWVGVIVVLV